MRALVLCLAAAACDNAPSPPLNDMAMPVDMQRGPPDFARNRPFIDYIDCDMGVQPFLRIDGGYCIFCYGPNYPCCAGNIKCFMGTACNDAAPLPWCE